MSAIPAPQLRPETAVEPSIDRRLTVMRCLVIADWLPGEWDPVRLLLIPRQDGLMARRRVCVVPDCPALRDYPASSMCKGHQNQLARSGAASVEEWLAAGGPVPLPRRLGDESCVVVGADGTGCPRPAREPRDLCVAHNGTWVKQRARGVTFEAFLASARPLPSYGDCTAGSCYRVAACGLGLCDAHYKRWIGDGSPRGDAFDRWRRRARQPSNRRILSLRGLPELVRLEVLYGVQRRVAEQIKTGPENMSTFVDHLRAAEVASVLDFDMGLVDGERNRDHGRFARFVVNRVTLAYRDPESELTGDCWDLRVLGRRGQLDFTPITQDWLRDGVKQWAAATMGRLKDTVTLQVRVRAMGVLSKILATGPGGGDNPAALNRRDVDRFLLRMKAVSSPNTGTMSPNSAFHIAKSCGLVIREATEMGFLPGLNPTFLFRRGDTHWPIIEEEEGRALPAHVVAQLDNHTALLTQTPGAAEDSPRKPAHRSLGVLGERAGTVAVLAYLLLKGTGRRVGEIASLHLDCLDVDEHGKAVLIYDNHKASRMRRRLPLADSDLVAAIAEQQTWVATRFPATPRERLWLLPRANKNADGTVHIAGGQLLMWLRAWVDNIPVIDAGVAGADGQPVAFDRSAITCHAFRHTYAQTLADEGVPPSVLRDLMDHRNMDTTLGYYKVNETKKRQAMELLARHTVDNLGATRPTQQPQSRAAELREQLSWVAVPMGKCSEPTNVRAGGQACPIRYQCAGCPHFESDPSYLPDLRVYADDLRREREMLLAMGAAHWVIANVAGQLDVIVDHIGRHEQLLQGLPAEQRDAVEDASRTVRKARQSVPVAFGRRQKSADDG